MFLAQLLFNLINVTAMDGDRRNQFTQTSVTKVFNVSITSRFIIYFATAAVAVDSSHTCMTASSSASWSRFSPPSDFVNGHVSTMWFMVCSWPQSQEGDWARPRFCKLARDMGLDLSENGSSETMYDEGDGNLAVVQ